MTKKALIFTFTTLAVAAGITLGLGCIYNLGAEAHASTVMAAQAYTMTEPDGGFFALIMRGEYLPAVGIALTFFVSGLRLMLVKVPFFDGKPGKYLLGFGSAALLYLGAAWQSHAEISIGVFAAAIGAGWAAAGGWEHIKDLTDWLRGTGTTSDSSSKTPDQSGGAIQRTILGACLLLCLMVACAGHPPAGTLAKEATIMCTNLEQGQLIGFALELGTALRDEVTSSGDVNWDLIEAKAISRGVDYGGCVLAEWIKGMTGGDRGARGQASQALTASTDPALAMYARFRAHYPGVKWQLADGIVK